MYIVHTCTYSDVCICTHTAICMHVKLIHTLSFYPIIYSILLYIKYPKTYPNTFKCMYVCGYVQSAHIHTLFHIYIFTYSIFLCMHAFDNYTASWQNYIWIFDMILSTGFEGSLVLVELLIFSVMQ